MNIKHLEKSECFFFSFTNNKVGGRKMNIG